MKVTDVSSNTGLNQHVENPTRNQDILEKEMCALPSAIKLLKQWLSSSFPRDIILKEGEDHKEQIMAF